jgi:hypothetical protein
MYMLSFTNGIPIARIEGGEHHNKTLYIYDKNQKCCEKCSALCDSRKRKCCKNCAGFNIKADIPITDPINMLGEQYFRGKKKYINLIELEKLRKAITKNIEPLDNDLNIIYHGAKIDLDKKTKTELMLHDGRMIPLPYKDEEVADHVYCAGPTGSGKSTWVGNYIKEIKKMFPKKQLFIFSSFDKDKALDPYDPIRIEINDELIETPIEKEEIADSIVVFDDIDTIKAAGKKTNRLAEACQYLRDDLLQCGRKEHIKTMCTSHQLMNYTKTRNLLNECQKIVFFPRATSPYHNKRFLKEYCGLEAAGIKKLLKLPTRWIMICKNFPMYAMYESGVILLNQLDQDEKDETNSDSE